MMRLFVYVIFFSFLVLSLFGQKEQSKRKPVLIRADRTEEKIEEAPPTPDPRKAKEHLEIGDFYFKRENYKAAEDRYREAIQHNPKSVKAHKKLIQALEKQKAFLKALEVCEKFVQDNPSSKEVERFQKWLKKLKRESEKMKKKQG